MCAKMYYIQASDIHMKQFNPRLIYYTVWSLLSCSFKGVMVYKNKILDNAALTAILIKPLSQ